MVPKYPFIPVIYLIIISAEIIDTVSLNKMKYESNENSIENESDYDDETEETTKSESLFGKADLKMKELEKRLDDFLDWYYEKYINPKHQHKNHIDSKKTKATENLDPHDLMQSDQPAPFKNVAVDDDDGVEKLQNNHNLSPLYMNLSSIVNFTKYTEENNNVTDAEYMRVLRNRTKDTWIQMLKDNILRQVGRVNSSMPKTGEQMELSALNISHFIPHLHIPNDSFINEEFVTEKIRSYYPSCEIPKNTDQDVWKDENTMNLYFNVENGLQESDAAIATAILRLYRLPQENISITRGGVSDASCENSSTNEEEKLFRVSIYWYTKSLKRHRVKRRLSDSKVIGENSKWVELSVRSATKAWVKGKNLGLAILLEDQEGTVLQADKYFKGASCTVGMSTPKPIPTVIIDAARWANELERSNGNSGGNTAAALSNHVSLLPTIDICTLEFPANSTYNPLSITNLRINARDLKKMHDQTQKLLERERLEKFAALAGIVPSSRHIRHQRQHLQEINADPRSGIIGHQIVLTNEELRNYNAQLKLNNATDNNR